MDLCRALSIQIERIASQSDQWISAHVAAEAVADISRGTTILLDELTKPSSYGPSRLGPFKDPRATA
jgi:hypothetical protein